MGKKLFATPVKPRSSVSWGPFYALFGTIGVFLIPQFFLVGIISLIFLDGIESPMLEESTPINFVLQLSAATIGLLLVYLLILRARGWWRELGWKFKISGKEIWRIVKALLSYYAFSLLILAILASFLPDSVINAEQNVGYEQTQNSLELLLIGLGLVVIAPVSEEIIFRGFLFRGIRNQANFWLAAIFSSGLFAVAHLQLNVGIDVFVMGLVACWLVEKTGSVVPGIILHGAKNAIAFSALFMIG